MTVINLPLPDELDKALNALSTDKEKFIIDALKYKLRTAKLETIQDELIEGYKGSHTENMELLNDYKHVDLEHWDEY